jgi:hypothetical protein
MEEKVIEKNVVEKNPMEEKKLDAFRVGVGVLILLGVLTLGEFWLGAVASYWWAPLIGVAILKAFFVMRDYMHVGRLFAADEVEE